MNLTTWLQPLVGLPLECDGLTRVISTLMQRNKIEHQVHSGKLTVIGIGGINLHWWIQLSDGSICDYRARMWLGDHEAVPHGIFMENTHHLYESHHKLDASITPLIFNVLTGILLDEYPNYNEIIL